VSDGTDRGRVGLYLGAFVLMIVSGASVAAGAKDFLSSMTPIWVSIVCSIAAALMALVAVLVPRRG
jgi:hypothetical protein